MPDYLTVEQAAAELDLSKSMVLYLIDHDEIEARKFDPDKETSPWMIDPASVSAYQKRKSVPVVPKTKKRAQATKA